MRLDKVMHGGPLLYGEHNRQRTTAMDRPNDKNVALQQEYIPNQKEVNAAISTLNELMEPSRTNLKFELHDKLEKYYVSVVDTNTDEVIKEIPPKKMLDMYVEMAEFMGILIDEKI